MLYFETVAKKAPSDENFLREIWFKTMITVGDIGGQQKAAMALSRLKNKRHYVLWAISSTYVAIKNNALKSGGSIFAQLALRMFTSAVDPIQTPQEAYLKALLLQLNGKTQELIDFLLTDQILEWDFLDLSIFMKDALVEAKEWEKLKTHTMRVLKDLNRDDFNHWKALIDACINLGEIDFVYKFIRDYKVGQNSKLAVVYLSSKLTGQNTQVPSLNKSVEEYFEFMCDKRSVYNDLLEFVSLELFDTDAWLEFLQKFPVEKDQLNLPATIAKFKFLLRKESYDLDDLVKEQFELYKQSTPSLKNKDFKDYHSGDDHLLIAVYAILENSSDVESLEKAAVILEYALLNDFHQFYVRLWLVRIYLLLGAFKKAYSHYKVLRVQKVQVASISHFILTRAMTLYPSEEPLLHALDLYQTFDDEINHGIYSLFENQTFNQVEGFYDLRNAVHNGITKKLLEIQYSQLQLFTKIKTQWQDMLKSEMISSGEIQDHRDFDIMFDIPALKRSGTKALPLSQTLTLGNRVGAHWAKTQLLQNEIIDSLLKSPSELQAKIEEYEALLSAGSDELTEAEQWSAETIHVLAKSAMNKTDNDMYDSILKQLTSFKFKLVPPDTTNNNNNNNSSNSSYSWVEIHNQFVVAQTAARVNRYLFKLHASRSQVKYSRDRVDRLKAEIQAQVVQPLKQAALVLKALRPSHTKRDVQKLTSWASQLGILSPSSTSLLSGLTNEVIENTVDGLYHARDEALTIIRTTSI